MQVALAGGVLGANSAPQVGLGASPELLLHPPLGGSEPPLDDHHRPRGVPRDSLGDHRRSWGGVEEAKVGTRHRVEYVFYNII